MSLLLKALTQVESRPSPPKAAPELRAAPATTENTFQDQTPGKHSEKRLDRNSQANSEASVRLMPVATSTSTIDLGQRKPPASTQPMYADTELIAAAVAAASQPPPALTAAVRKSMTAVNLIPPSAAPGTAPNTTVRGQIDFDSQLDRFAEYFRSVIADIAHPATEVSNGQPPPAVKPLPVAASVDILPPALPTVRDEYRDLRDSILSQLPSAEHRTLLFVDAGRATNDASWLWPMAASFLQKTCDLQISSGRPQREAARKILLVEAAGPNCGIANLFGIDSAVGLNDCLGGKKPLINAVLPTFHPQIKLLTLGKQQLLPDDGAGLVQSWADLKKHFDVLLVAAGPLNAMPDPGASQSVNSTATLFLPVADAVVLCVELSGTPQSLATNAKGILQRGGVNLLGCVVRGESAA